MLKALIKINKIGKVLAFLFTGLILVGKILACVGSTELAVNAKDSNFYYSVPRYQLDQFKFESAIKFWHKAMQLSSDSVLVYTQKNRQILAVMPKKETKKFEDSCCKDSVFHNFRFNNNLPYNLSLRYLEGKSDFYQWDQVKKYLKPAGDVFSSLDVNPIYAQFVLLIECPANPNGVSSAGAAGHFQLMPFVARKYGLRITQQEDERKLLDRGAYAAAMHFKQYCIPMANRILKKHNIEIQENELWYQLFVLHIYNAGAGNVAKAMDVIGSNVSGSEIIKQLWQTTAGGFKNSSQNYSQLAVAAYLIFAGN